MPVYGNPGAPGTVDKQMSRGINSHNEGRAISTSEIFPIFQVADGIILGCCGITGSTAELYAIITAGGNDVASGGMVLCGKSETATSAVAWINHGTAGTPSFIEMTME